MDQHPIVHTGDPRHAEHEAWLLELGKATYQSARVAGIAFDLLRVYFGVESADMYEDTLGVLENKLKSYTRTTSAPPDIETFISSLESSRKTRNDLIHALPVKDGLYRRRLKPHPYIRSFYTLEDLKSATAELKETHRLGSRILYHDEGAAVREWMKHGR